MLKILYFASLREAIGCGREDIEFPVGIATAGALRECLGQRHTALLTSKNLRVAINQTMVDLEAPVADGDEIAFFPPVTGG
jgi:molybdopterin synthase sulfur carrier subunit